MIDLRSDTITRPTSAMLTAMQAAQVGDDVFKEDPTIIQLETSLADRLGMEAGLYCPSGTMTNQIAIRVHVSPGDEVICDHLSHVYNYEGGGIAANSGASVRLLNGDRGRFTAADVSANINPDDEHFPISRLVVAENTCNKGGGSCWDLEQLKAIEAVCRQHGLAFHLDGARLFNALVRTGDNPLDFGATFDSISICLSKGLGCPVGSVLLGSSEFIARARRVRKLMGGGMRQAGYLAAAGIYALGNNIERLAEDHRRAADLGEILANCHYVNKVLPVETNIVIFELNQSVTASDFVSRLEADDIAAIDMGINLVRMVTHLDFSDDDLEKVKQAIRRLDI